VTGIQNRTVANTAPTDGQALAWNNSSSQWEPTTVSGGGGGNYPFIVAASDSPAEWQAVATATAPGTGDEVTLQAVIDAAAADGVGGEVLIAPGNYNVTVAAGSFAVDVPTGIKLRGAGPQYSTIYMENGGDPGAGSQVIRLGVNASLEGLYIGSYFQTRGVSLVNAGGRNRIQNCYLDSEYACVSGNDVVRVWLENNQLECSGADTEAAVYFEGNIQNVWIKNNFIRGGSIGVHIDGNAPGDAPGRITIADNHIEQTGYQGILLDDTDPGIGFIRVTGNVINAAGQNAIGADNFGGIQVIGNSAVDTINSASLNEEFVFIISENSLENINQGHGIFLSGSTGTQVLNNNIEAPGEHGIYLTDTTDVDITGNNIKWTQGAGPSYDGIHLADTSNRNRILNNKVIDDAIGGPPIPFRYGINIATADCNDNIIEGNDLSQTGTGTGTYNDAGTNTQFGPNTEWDLGTPASRTDGHVVSWNDTNQTFELAAGGGGGGGISRAAQFTVASGGGGWTIGDDIAWNEVSDPDNIVNNSGDPTEITFESNGLYLIEYQVFTTVGVDNDGAASFEVIGWLWESGSPVDYATHSQFIHTNGNTTYGILEPDVQSSVTVEVTNFSTQVFIVNFDLESQNPSNVFVPGNMTMYGENDNSTWTHLKVTKLR
jgi:parallel beta-helix repeat protein